MQVAEENESLTDTQRTEERLKMPKEKNKECGKMLKVSAGAVTAYLKL